MSTNRPQSRYGPDPESLLRVSEHFLGRRQFDECKKYARLVQKSDPSLPGVRQILAVAHVLLASQTQSPPNYYSILNLKSFSADPQLLKKSFKTLSFLLNPKKNQYPFANEAFELVRDAWQVLSDPLKKTQFDISLRNGNFENVGKGYGHSGKVDKRCGNSQKVHTFWTLCPYCCNVYEFRKVYEGCNLRCPSEKCRKAFRGLVINPPPFYVLKEGNYSGSRLSQWNPFAPVKSDVNEEGGKECGTVSFVEISDDSDNSCAGNMFEESSKRVESVELEEGPVSEPVIKRKKKSVGKNTKKVMGTGFRIKKHKVAGQLAEGLDLNTPAIDGEHDDCEKDVASAFVEGKVTMNGGDRGRGEAKCFSGDDDIFVGLDDI